jgi:hypothetical protein
MVDKGSRNKLPVSEKQETTKRAKLRNTGLIRIDKELRDIIKQESKITHKTMSRIVDQAVKKDMLNYVS